MGIEKKIIYFYKTKNFLYLVNEKMSSKYLKIMVNFCFNQFFKGPFSTRVKILKKRVLTREECFSNC